MLRSTLVLLLLSAAALVGASSLGAATSPRCFGAASLDPGHRCLNPALSRLVTPSPRDARRQPNAPCAVLAAEGALKPCAFGTPQRQAVATIALVGDSHAENWRGAVAAVAYAEHWRGISIALGGCPYSTITRVIPEPLRSHCAQRNRDLPGWFARHPEVHTVFAAQISGVPFEIQPGQSQFEAQVNAYEQAWSALPGSVTHIIVIRDTPKAFTRTHGCIEHAIASGTSAGATCRMPRRAVLDRDAAVAAAAQLGSGRVQVVDLTDHFCDRDWCYPVIGGALVQKDINHLTATFVETLGPYLLADVQQLMSSWDQ